MNNLKMVFFGLVIQSLAIFANAQAPDPAEQCLLKRDTIDNPSISNDLTIDKIATEIAGFGDRYLNSLNKKSPLKDKIEKYIYSCEMLKVEIKDNLIPWTSTPNEIKKKKYDKQKNLTENSKLCLSTTLFALGYEEESVKKFEVDAACTKEKMDVTTKAIENDVSFLKKLEAMNNENIGALGKEIDPDAPVKNFTSAQLKAIEESGNFSDVASTKPYYSVLEAGISFMPEYDSEGKNQGFKESNFFAVLRLNNRMALDFTSHNGFVFYQALDVAFYSAPIACNENDSDDGSVEDPEDHCDGPNTDVTKLKFRDISNTVNASVYGSLMYRNDSIFGNWEIGNSIRYGALNRDQKGPDGDSVAKFYNYGVEMRLNDFLNGNGDVTYLSGMPKFMINYSEGKNEDFAGAGVKTKRKIASFNYRIFDNQPVFIGLIVDGGKGPDTIALNISYGLKASSIFGLFAD